MNILISNFSEKQTKAITKKLIDSKHSTDQGLELDAVIVESSKPGAEISKTISSFLKQKKPVFMLISEKEQTQVFPVIEDELRAYINVSYYSDHTLSKEIDKIIKDLRLNPGNKFTMLLPDRLVDYLDWLSKEKGVAKSAIIKGLIEDSAKKSKVYEKSKANNSK